MEIKTSYDALKSFSLEKTAALEDDPEGPGESPQPEIVLRKRSRVWDQSGKERESAETP